MTVSQTADLVRKYFIEQAPHWRLHPESIRVEYVPSPGGFGPMNFTVKDESLSYHLKLNKTAEELAPWIRSADRLASTYRAPRLLGQIDIAGRYGAVFERLPGETPTGSPPLGVLDGIVAMCGGLHQDSELSSRLGGDAYPARRTLLDYHIAMCEEDLDEIEGSLPLPFVSKELGAWMRDETMALRMRALRSAAFDEPVSSPIHGDLWFGNVLVDGDRWWIIDWDDLKIGDPAHDLSLILFTTISDNFDARWLELHHAAFIERFQLYCQAALLTFVVDPLADWITAEEFPAVRDQARVDREALHRWALGRYRQLYL